MSARDAVDRLRRIRQAAKPEELSAARLPQWPARAFDCELWPACGCPAGTVRHGCPGVTRIALPPDGAAHDKCVLWPECGCAGDCDRLARALAGPDRAAIAFIVLFGLVAAVLLWWVP